MTNTIDHFQMGSLFPGAFFEVAPDRANCSPFSGHWPLIGKKLLIQNSRNVTLFLLVHSQRRLHVVFFIGGPKRPTRSGSLKTRKVMSDQRKRARAISSLFPA